MVVCRTRSSVLGKTPAEPRQVIPRIGLVEPRTRAAGVACPNGPQVARPRKTRAPVGPAPRAGPYVGVAAGDAAVWCLTLAVVGPSAVACRLPLHRRSRSECTCGTPS